MGGFDGPHMLRALQAMRHSIFSLQPPGDDPARQSIVQSLTVGCIPVLFVEQQLALWPLHWGAWVNESTVFLPAAGVRSGRFNVIDALSRIPEGQIRRMQRTIRRNVRRMIYSLQPNVGQPDAFDILLEEVRYRSLSH